jgi:DNA-binding LacI/PurR family transcriptional regulator
MIRGSMQFRADVCQHPISRIGQPVEDMAKLATKLLFESIETKQRLNSQLELAPKIILRESVKNLIP